jgi:hypothetical protein
MPRKTSVNGHCFPSLYPSADEPRVWGLSKQRQLRCREGYGMRRLAAPPNGRVRTKRWPQERSDVDLTADSWPPTLNDVTGQVINSACLTQSPTEQIAPCVGGS